VAFPVWAFGTQDEPGGSVDVELPPGYAPEIQGFSMSQSQMPDGGVRLTARPDDPLAFFAYLSAERPGAFSNHAITLSLDETQARFLVRAWEDDPAWDQEVARLLRRGLPALESLIGVEYPVGLRVSVEEAATSRLGEYAGVYNRLTGVIRVRYDADAFVTLHEAAHLWFNDQLFQDRWIGEAWAEFYGVTAGQRIGASGAIFDLTDDLLDARIPLNDWGEIGVESLQVEDFAYAATYGLARRIAHRAELAGLRDVWRAAEAKEMAYQPMHASATATSAARPEVEGWQRLLDLLEERTDESFTDLWQDWVVNDPEQRQLAARQAARHEYAEALAAAEDWELPAAIRGDLEAWQFKEANDALADAEDVLDDRDLIEASAADLQLTPPDTLRAEFEGNGGLQAAAEEADAERSALRLLTSATAQLEGEPALVEAIGLLGTNPELDLAAARDAFEAGQLDEARLAAARATEVRQDADDTGRFRVLAAGGAILLFDLLVMGMLVGRRRRGHPLPSTPTAPPVS
jgi:hypothetical protein